MKPRFIIFAFLLSLILLPWSSVMAASSTTTSPSPDIATDPFDMSQSMGCSAKNPTDVCHVPIDIVTARIPLSQDDINTFGFDPVGIAKTAVMNWAGVVHPDGAYHITTDRMSNQYSNELQNASDMDLNPAQLQMTETHDTTEKKFCVTARLCVSDPTTGKLAGDFLTDTEFCTADDVPGLNIRTEANKRFASYETRYVQPSQNYTSYDIKTKKLSAAGCSDKANGQDLQELDVSYQDQNQFGKDEPVITRIAYTIEGFMVHEITKTIHDISGAIQSIVAWQSKFPVPARYVASAMLPWAGHNLALAAGLSSMSDIAPVAYVTAAQAAALGQAGGWINGMFRNDQFASNYNTPQRDGKYTGQAWVLTMGQEHAQADTYHYAEAQELAAWDFQACSLTRGDMQASQVPQSGCDRSWAGPSATLSIPDVPPTPPNPEDIRSELQKPSKRTPPSCKNPNTSVGKGWNSNDLTAAMTAAASWANIPECVLKGVNKIEWDDSPPQSACVPNQCGAAGPFQISVGVDSCGSPTCDNCGPGWKGRACNNETWALKLAGGSAASACDPKISAEAAAAVLIGKAKYFGLDMTTNGTTFDPNNTTQKNAIISGADAYYGVPASIQRLNNLSYGQYVYQTCLQSLDPNATFPPTPDAFPTPATTP